MSFIQPELPYGLAGLAPYLSEEQLTFHYGKHHAAYFAKLNSLVAGTPDEECSLDALIVSSTGAVFNNAAQAFNHTFYWKCMTAEAGGGEPPGNLKAGIERCFHSVEAFKDEFSKAAAGLFGSGWTWLAADGDSLEILALPNADTPLKHGKVPILTIDVWEHAYYVDYRNDRLKFIAGFWNVVNWAFASETYAARK